SRSRDTARAASAALQHAKSPAPQRGAPGLSAPAAPKGPAQAAAPAAPASAAAPGSATAKASGSHNDDWETF
ncbi:methyl-accepting chemotaxis protein, partial [Acidovorax sp. PRC11]|nr:methyl-accepting chemotaxis protein [Acidovorax sp. PRC11]